MPIPIGHTRQLAAIAISAKPPAADTDGAPAFAELLDDRRALAETSAAPAARTFLTFDLSARPVSVASEAVAGSGADADPPATSRASGTDEDARAAATEADGTFAAREVLATGRGDDAPSAGMRRLVAPTGFALAATAAEQAAESPTHPLLSTILQAAGGGIDTAEPATGASEHEAAHAAARTALARDAALRDRPLPVSVTLHGQREVELSARVAGSLHDEVELARVARRMVGQSGLRLSGIVVNGRRIERPSGT